MNYDELRKDFHGQFDRLRENAKFAYKNAMEALKSITKDDLDTIDSNLCYYLDKIDFWDFDDNRISIIFFSIFCKKRDLEKLRFTDKEGTNSGHIMYIYESDAALLPYLNSKLSNDSDGFTHLTISLSEDIIIFYGIKNEAFAKAIFGEHLIRWKKGKKSSDSETTVSTSFFEK